MDNPLPYLDTIGLQLWSVRDQMEKDLELTLKTIKSLRYYQVEVGDTRILKDIKPVCDDLDLKIHTPRTIRPSNSQKYSTRQERRV
jgi:hypothetical protein